MNAALTAIFGSLINWLLYNIELACTSEAAEERDTSIKEANGVLRDIYNLKLLIPDLSRLASAI